MKVRRILLLVVAAATVAYVVFAIVVRPSNDRDWKTDHARLPMSRFDGSQVRIEGVRNFISWSRDSVSTDYYDSTYDLDTLKDLWLVVSVFDEQTRRGPAHTMLSFGFDGGQYVVISVEARKEVEESYSIIQGLFRRYELIYVVGDERDLVATRAIHRNDDVYLYPIKASREGIRALFIEMLEAANELHERPRFYNTLTGNCTTKLADHVNAVAPGTIPPSWRLILPGYVDELIQRLDLLDEDEDIATVRRRYWINDKVRAAEHAGDFSLRIRSTQ